MPYSELADRHIFCAGPWIETSEDWVQIAMAALDQAGLNQREQTKVEDLIRELGYRLVEPRHAVPSRRGTPDKSPVQPSPAMGGLAAAANESNSCCG